MERQFGAAYAESVAADQVLGELQGRTVTQALADGVPAKEVWRAVVSAWDLPAAAR